MSSGITKEQLKQALSRRFDRLLNEVVEAVNQAKAGRIIADSEEPVRDAAGEFRRMLFEKALELRSQREAFSPMDVAGNPSLKWRSKGNQTIHAVTVNGSIAIRRRIWWAHSQGCCAPLDPWLGLPPKYSPGVRE